MNKQEFIHIDQVEPKMIKENDGEKVVIASGPNVRDQRDLVFTMNERGFLLLLGRRNFKVRTCDRTCSEWKVCACWKLCKECAFGKTE